MVKRFAIPTTRIVAVIGASGSGKSSLVGAGLIPRLHAGAFPGSAGWVTVRFTPAERGSDPFLNLMRRLAPTLASPSTPLETIADTLRTHPIEINALAAQVLQGKSANAELLLFADQFEEIFSARVEERHRGPFISLMDEIARSPRIRLVLTLRADYYEHCTRDPRLAAWLREGSFPLAAPTPLALAEMIERPARVAGLDPEPGLADAILQDAGTEPGALALVEFALEELYERSGGKRLTLAAYRALGGKGGGIGGVIEGQAEKAVQDAAGKVDEAALAKIFPLLADVDERGGTVRKRARRDSFAEREEALINRLVDGRLLVTNKDDANLSWVEVAHEAVLRHWSRLSNWLTDNRDFLLWRRRLKVWLDSRSLLHGAQLTVAKDWRKRRGHHALTPEENALVSKSIRRHWSTRLGAVLTAFAGGFLLWMQQAQLSPKLAGLVVLSYLGHTPAPEMVAIPEGSRFTMGSPESEPDRSPKEGPQHEVAFANEFAIGKYEVTFDEYDLFLKSVERDGGCEGGRQPERPGDEGWDRGRRPAINVSWRDATCYAEWLTKKRGLDDKHRYRLPTEAEWEYAARAGTTARYWWGDELGKNNANCYGCRSQWDDKQTAPVGSFQPNAFGVHDMLGNTWEWVEDCWHEDYDGAPKDGSAWEQQGGDCDRRVIRGGSWDNGPRSVRSADRNRDAPGNRSDDIGFRLAQDN